MTINIIFASIPHAKASATANADGSYSIVVSKSLSQEQAKREVELGHIVDDDFGKDMQASMIEEMIRRSNIVPDKVDEDVEFYYHVV